MRIIGGKWRGIKLAPLLEGDLKNHLRPSADRAREAIFNILESHKYEKAIAGARVLDLFAGTGALGLEALSRGALSLHSVENGVKSLRILNQNIEKLDAQSVVLEQDARLVQFAGSQQFDLVFLDPPYAKGLGESAIENLINNKLLADGALIIWEELVRPAAPVGLKLQDQRKYGKALIHIYEWNAPSNINMTE